MPTPISDYIQTHKLLTDGSFGTYYAEKYGTEDMPELANRDHPERVIAIHREYVDAGAKLLRTNTFTINSVHIPDEAERTSLLRSAVTLARVAAGDREVYIAGDIGAISEYQYQDAAEKAAEYVAIGRALLAEGLDILLFETVSSLDCVLEAIRTLKAEHTFFAMVQFSVNQFGYSSAGLSARRLLRDAADAPEIDATGLNCGIGPGHMEQILRTIPPMDKPLVAMPNAGYPRYERTRIHFADNTEYFAMKMQGIAALGADILGGCCGTRPKYIRALAESIDWTQNNKPQADTVPAQPAISVTDHSFFRENGQDKTHKLIAVELAPPLKADDAVLMDAAHLLKRMNVDVVTFPDSPSGRTRADSVLMAEKVLRETDLCVMPHICCRDKNAIATRSQLLGAHLNGIHNLLVITGDPIPMMARESVKSVFNFDSVGLMKIIRDMNEEVFPQSPMAYGGAINQGRRNLDVEIRRVRQKMDAGATFFLTQPVFGAEDADRVRRIKDETGARILCGIMPLVSRRNALFMKNEMTGIAVTDAIVAQYGADMTRQQGEAVGVRIAKEVIDLTDAFADGYYFSFPFNRVHLLEHILGKS